MLFHVTMTHTADNCPGYDPAKMNDLVASADKLEAVEKDARVKVHFSLWAAPEHAGYALLEADNLSAVARWVNAIPIRQEFKVTPVQHFKDVLETGKAMAAQQRR